MFNLRLCNAATIRYSLLKFGHMHLCGKDYKHFSPHCCKCNSFGCIAAIRCVNACHGPQNDSVYSGSEHRQFNSPRLVKREAGFPNPRRALIGSNQLWRVNDSPYYRELVNSSPPIVPHIYASLNRVSIGSDNGLSPIRRQAITWTNAGFLLNGLLRTNISEILIWILSFSSKKMRLKVSSAKRRPFFLGFNVLRIDRR